jgi:DNA-binding HxlR family transcriptional regulator
MVKVTATISFRCPVETTLAVVGGQWKPLILWHLGEGKVRRFLELQRLIPGITRKMLTQHLRELECDGVVARKVFHEVAAARGVLLDQIRIEAASTIACPLRLGFAP